MTFPHTPLALSGEACGNLTFRVLRKFWDSWRPHNTCHIPTIHTICMKFRLNTWQYVMNVPAKYDKNPVDIIFILCLKNIGHYFWQGMYKIFSGNTSIRTHAQKNTNSQWHKTHTITSQVNLFIIFSLLRFWSARRSYVNFGTSNLRTKEPGLFGL